jgi:G3E family GTPase
MAAMRVNLLFGFLGSGKTTLARHLLAHREPGVKTAVIVNEFGEVGVDGEILRGSNVDVVELNSGCLCCTLRGSLMMAVEELREKSAVGRVIVEATGVAQPAELLETLADKSMKGGLDIGPLVTVVDIAKFPKLVAMLGDFYLDQIENADVLVANKIDLATPEQLEAVARELRELNPDADLVFAEQGRVEPQVLFERRLPGIVARAREELAAASADEGGGAGRAERGHAAHDRGHHGHDHPGHSHDHGHHDHHHDHDHAHDPHAAAPPQSFVVTGSGSARREGLERFFASLPDNIWRAKGFLSVDGAPCLVQYSLGQLEVTPAKGPASETLVFIGQRMDRPAIEARYALAGRA